MRDPGLQATALRYAAGDLPAGEAAAFESRLAEDQAARDALAEAVRLSAQAIGQVPPAPRASFRAALRERLSPRAYRGSPLAWAALGAAAVAACTVIGLALAGSDRPAAVTSAAPDVQPPSRGEPREHASAPRADAGDDSRRSVAEIWADLSSHAGVEKARDDELRWRHRVRDLGSPHVTTATRAAAPNDVRDR